MERASGRRDERRPDDRVVAAAASRRARAVGGWRARCRRRGHAGAGPQPAGGALHPGRVERRKRGGGVVLPRLPACGRVEDGLDVGGRRGGRVAGRGLRVRGGASRTDALDLEAVARGRGDVGVARLRHGVCDVRVTRAGQAARGPVLAARVAYADSRLVERRGTARRFGLHRCRVVGVVPPPRSALDRRGARRCTRGPGRGTQACSRRDRGHHHGRAGCRRRRDWVRRPHHSPRHADDGGRHAPPVDSAHVRHRRALSLAGRPRRTHRPARPRGPRRGADGHLRRPLFLVAPAP